MDKLPLDRVRWPLVALLASAAMLAAAYAIENFEHLAPCPMCWWQRYVYFAAAPIALVAIVLNWRGAGHRLMTAFSVLLGLTFLVGVFIATWHALVEYGVLPSPDTCAAAPVSNDGRPLSEILSQPIAVVSCKDALWHFPAGWGLSMAGWNGVVSLVLAALSFYSATKPPMRADTANEPVRA